MSQRRVFNLTSPQEIDEAEANVNEAEPIYVERERQTGLLWTLIIGRARLDIAAARERLAKQPPSSPAI